MKLLIVEDEEDILNSIADYLSDEGYICEKANNLFHAEDKVAIFQYDLIILDITLPDGSGFKLLQQIKKNWPETGVLILSARDSLDDRLKGLDMGADDYITKPFHLAELNSRINAIIRRRNYKGSTKITFHEIEIDTEARQVKVNDKTLDLTRKEYALLLYFVTNKKRVLSKQAIAEHLWGDHIDMADDFDFIYTHIRNLRKKIKEADGTDYLKTIYGMGYKYTDS